MVMKLLLIGLLVISTVAMLETDVNAGRICDFIPCICYTPVREGGKISKTVTFLPEGSKTPLTLEELVSKVKKDKGGELWIIGHTDRAGRTRDYDRLSRTTADVVKVLIQRGLYTDIIIRGMMLENHAPQECPRKEQEVIVAWPASGQDKR